MRSLVCILIVFISYASARVNRCQEENVSLDGQAKTSSQKRSPSDCQAACTGRCEHWVWRNGQCTILKEGNPGKKVGIQGAVSGGRNGTSCSTTINTHGIQCHYSQSRDPVVCLFPWFGEVPGGQASNKQHESCLKTKRGKTWCATKVSMSNQLLATSDQSQDVDCGLATSGQGVFRCVSQTSCPSVTSVQQRIADLERKNRELEEELTSGVCSSGSNVQPNGGWSNWSPWSKCSKTCNGEKTRTRSCPRGNKCSGSNTRETQPCGATSCGTQPTSTSSCRGRCGKTAALGQCQCTDNCFSFGDCCSDYTSTCSAAKTSNNGRNQGGLGGYNNNGYGNNRGYNNNNRHGYGSNTGQGNRNRYGNDRYGHRNNYGANNPNSCEGRCGDRFDRNQPCQCNLNCADFKNCCTDFSRFCKSSSSSSSSSSRPPVSGPSGARPASGSDPALGKLTEKLLVLDANNAMSGITLNPGCTSRVGSQRDCSSDPLFTRVDTSIFRKPVYQKLMAMYENYDPDVTKVEDHTRAERAEESDFINEIMRTMVMKETFSFLKQNKYFTKSESDFKNLLKELWFGVYSRGMRIMGSSGFEHVFLGEKKAGKVQGFHNWVYFYHLEKQGKLNYIGHWENVDFGGKGTGLSFTFKWGQEQKPFASMLVGTSPELELAIYTTCLLVKNEDKCNVSLAGKKIEVEVHVFNRPRGVRYIASSFMDF